MKIEVEMLAYHRAAGAIIGHLIFQRLCQLDELPSLKCYRVSIAQVLDSQDVGPIHKQTLNYMSDHTHSKAKQNSDRIRKIDPRAGTDKYMYIVVFVSRITAPRENIK